MSKTMSDYRKEKNELQRMVGFSIARLARREATRNDFIVAREWIDEVLEWKGAHPSPSEDACREANAAELKKVRDQLSRVTGLLRKIVDENDVSDENWSAWSKLAFEILGLYTYRLKGVAITDTKVEGAMVRNPANYPQVSSTPLKFVKIKPGENFFHIPPAVTLKGTWMEHSIPQKQRWWIVSCVGGNFVRVLAGSGHDAITMGCAQMKEPRYSCIAEPL